MFDGHASNSRTRCIGKSAKGIKDMSEKRFNWMTSDKTKRLTVASANDRPFAFPDYIDDRFPKPNVLLKEDVDFFK